MFSNAQNLLLQIHEAVPDQQVVLAAGMATSDAASTSVANLTTVPDVDEFHIIIVRPQHRARLSLGAFSQG